MNVIACLQADLDVTSLGTRSRLADELRGITVLRRTVERLRRAKLLKAVCVLCPTAQYGRCAELLDGCGALIHRYDAEPPPWASLVRAARKWSLDGWRGGLGGTTSFDEYTDCRLINGLLKAVPAEAVLSVPPAAPLIDPDLVDRLIEHAGSVKGEARLAFTQAPPGITGIWLDALLVAELAEKNVPLGWILNYKPDAPQKDLIFQPCCMEIPAELRHATGRLIVDTGHGAETVDALLRDCGEVREGILAPAQDATTIGRWLLEREASAVTPFPREVEIELTTEDPYPSALLRPRGDRAGRRGPIDPAIVEQITAELTRYDASLVVLGGFGDPLRHPEFASVLSALRPGASRDPPTCGSTGVYGLAVRTSAVDLDDERIEMLIEHEVDVLQVVLDAWSAELYGRLQSPANPSAAKLDEVLSRLDRLGETRGEHKVATPIVLPEMTKARENVHELDAFYDGWLRRIGAVSITGYSHRGGQCEDRSVINMAPSARGSCRRLKSRCLVLADGRVTLCDQDYRGLHTLGRIGPQSLEQIWQSESLRRVRDAHEAGRFGPTPLCEACDEWHRP